MTIQKNSYVHLLHVIHENRAPNGHFVTLERAVVILERAVVITTIAFLIVAACAFAKVGAFASCDYSQAIGFSCLVLCHN